MPNSLCTRDPSGSLAWTRAWTGGRGRGPKTVQEGTLTTRQPGPWRAIPGEHTATLAALLAASEPSAMPGKCPCLL